MLEVCIDSLESAINAIRGGADELEVCSSLPEGGLTPSAGLVKQIVDMVTSSSFDKSNQNIDSENAHKKVKVNVMIRCRTGSDFCYSEEEMKIMLTDIDILKPFGVDRFVFGALTILQLIDENNCAKVIAKAHPLPVTFHRAFDVCKDAVGAVERIHDLGFSRLLTSGQNASVNDCKAIECIRTLLSYGDKIEIMPGAGINVENGRKFIDMGCKIVHSSCKRVRYLPKIENNLCMGTSDSDQMLYVTDENIVKQLKYNISH